MSKFLDSSGLLKLINLLKDNTVEASTIELASVATSGLYSDLLNQPTIIAEAPSDGKQYARKNGGWVEVEASSSSSSDSTVYLPFVDSYVSNCNTWFTNGYTKVSKTATTNQPALCTGDDKWGILFFISENASTKTGSQMYFPIDGTYKGRIFYRSCVRQVFGDWNLIPLKTSELTNDVGFLTDAPSDNKQYIRKNGAWAEVDISDDDSLTEKINGLIDAKLSEFPRYNGEVD